MVRKHESGRAPIGATGPIGRIGVRVTEAFAAQAIWTYRAKHVVRVVPASVPVSAPTSVHGPLGGPGDLVAGRAFVVLAPSIVRRNPVETVAIRFALERARVAAPGMAGVAGRHALNKVFAVRARPNLNLKAVVIVGHKHVHARVRRVAPGRLGAHMAPARGREFARRAR